MIQFQENFKNNNKKIYIQELNVFKYCAKENSIKN